MKEKISSNGWLLIDKPEGIESYGVIRKLKFRYSFQKIGFAGTLDPLASGLLLIGVNKATKKIPNIHNEKKVILLKFVLEQQRILWIQREDF